MAREPLMLSDTAMALLRRHQQLEEDSSAFHTKMEEMRALYEQRDLTESDLMENLENLGTRHADIVAEHQHIPYELMAELWLLWSSPDLVPVRHLDWHLVLEGDLLAELEGLFVPAPTPLGVRRHDIVMRRYPSIGDFIDHMLAAIAQTRPEEAKV